MDLNETQNLTTEEKITKAKINLQQSNPFFAYLVSTLDLEEKKEIPSIGVDTTEPEKKRILYNPDFIDKQTTAELQGILAHEVGHIIFKHWENKNQNPELSNIAQDIVINDIISESNLTLPNDNPLLPHNHQVNFQGVSITQINEKTSEQVYKILEKKLPDKVKKKLAQQSGRKGGKQGQQKKGQGQGKAKKTPQNQNEKGGNGGKGDKNEIEGRFDEHQLGGQPNEKEKEKINQKIKKASTYAKSRGELPSKIQEKIEDLTESKMNWRTLLYKYIRQEIPFDYTWRRPNKKSHSLGTYLPDVDREKIEICVALDTSGSISNQDLRDFTSEVWEIVNSFQNIDLTLIQADAKIQDTKEINNYNQQEINDLEIKGRGGTDHIPVFDWVEKNKANTPLLICFTDGFTQTPQTRPNFDTLWVLPDQDTDKNFNFGKVIIQNE